MRIKDLKEGDVVRCFGTTDSYLVTVQRVVTDMTHYRDIAYVVNECGREGALTDNDEWIFFKSFVSNRKQEVENNETSNSNSDEGVKKLYYKLKRKQDNSRQSNDVQQNKRKVVTPKERYSIENKRDVRIPGFDPINWLKLEQNKQVDNVNQPSHYTYGNIEIIDIVEQVTATYPTNIAFSIGNALKYICRAPFKNGVEDLKKAVWYLNRAIDKWDKTNEDGKENNNVKN